MKIFGTMMALIKIFLAYLLFFASFRTKSDIWLISERGVDARDNGLAFYRYMKSAHPNVKLKYIITKKSEDYSRIDKRDIVQYRSFRHHLLYLKSAVLISTHPLMCCPNRRLYAKLETINALKPIGKKVFLQHGITKDNIKKLHYEELGADIFVCGGYPEYKYIKEKYGYRNESVIYSGFPRFDNLKTDDGGYILIMPTWRHWIKDLKSFKKSEYYARWMELLCDREFIDYLKRSKKKAIFYPHFEIQRYVKEFRVPDDSVMVAEKANFDVQELLKGCSLLITDYSSVFFDVAYMEKNTIYYQFDYEKYRLEHYNEGYFSYQNHGFGPVVKTKDELILSLKNEAYKNLEYRKRIDDFFRIRDRKNSERVYKKIMKVIK